MTLAGIDPGITGAVAIVEGGRGMSIAPCSVATLDRIDNNKAARMMCWF